MTVPAQVTIGAGIFLFGWIFLHKAKTASSSSDRNEQAAAPPARLFGAGLIIIGVVCVLESLRKLIMH
jgi:hypothetical protein